MRRLQTAVVAMCLVVAGCGGGSTGTSTTTPLLGGVDTTGLELFEERVVGANPGCVTCHSFDEGITLVGPSLFTVESRVPGLTTAEYVRQSIIDPDAYTVEGFVAGQMNPGWDGYLTEEQIESLVELITRG